MGEGIAVQQKATPGIARLPNQLEQAGFTVRTRAVALGTAPGGVAPGHHTHCIAIKGKIGKRPASSVADVFRHDASGAVHLHAHLDDSEARSHAVAEVVRELARMGVITGWRDELYAIRSGVEPGETPLTSGMIRWF